jgi:hypothetical protein
MTLSCLWLGKSIADRWTRFFAVASMSEIKLFVEARATIPGMISMPGSP